MTMRHPKRVRIWVATIALAALAAGALTPFLHSTAVAQDEADKPANNAALASVEDLSRAFRSVAEKVRPGVVQIRTTIKRDVKEQEEFLEKLPEEYREFFRKHGDRYRLPNMPPPQRQSTGSGVIIDADEGFILTNNHVVGDAEKQNTRVDVVLSDGRSLVGKVVGRDPNTDLALVHINAENLHALPLGDSDKMEVGDWVLAIGAPFGLEQSVTQGIISAKGRSAVGILPYEEFIQTDAAINPGNSGGPLVNMRGEVIAINTAIATSGIVAGYMGVGFAIPTSMVKELLPAMKRGEEIVRGYLGVGIKDMSDFEPGYEKTFGLEERRGVYINDVYTHRETPASKAGLKGEDIILEFDGQKLDSAQHLQHLVARTKPGTKVDLLVWRDRKEITIPVTIGKQPKDFFTWGGRGWRGMPYGDDEEVADKAKIEELGVTVEKLTPELAKKHDWEDEEDVKDLLVITEVDALGEAGSWGIRVGDLIESVQGKRITSAGQLRDALADAQETGARIRFKTKQGYRPFFLPPKE
jgi:serine protease Do